MKAISSFDNEVETVTLGEHKIDFGGPGDGFCYGHQSFSCLDNLTEGERLELDNAEYGEGWS